MTCSGIAPLTSCESSSTAACSCRLPMSRLVAGFRTVGGAGPGTVGPWRCRGGTRREGARGGGQAAGAARCAGTARQPAARTAARWRPQIGLLALVAVGSLRGPLGSGRERPSYPADLVDSLVLLLFLAMIAAGVLAVIALWPNRHLPVQARRARSWNLISPMAAVCCCGCSGTCWGWTVATATRTRSHLATPRRPRAAGPAGRAGGGAAGRGRCGRAGHGHDRGRPAPGRPAAPATRPRPGPSGWSGCRRHPRGPGARPRPAPGGDRRLGPHGTRPGRGRPARRPAEAPFEVRRQVLETSLARKASVHRLTGLFERAKFSQHAIGPADQDEAIAAPPGRPPGAGRGGRAGRAGRRPPGPPAGRSPEEDGR